MAKRSPQPAKRPTKARAKPSAAAKNAQDHWQRILADRLPRLGHRNWVVVADAAYPAQVGAIETVVTGAEHLTVLKGVLDALVRQSHVKPTVMLDSELAHVAEADAPGVQAYRDHLTRLLPAGQAVIKPHESIIHELHNAAASFEILLLKTNFTIPYTSVFFRLECGYWDDAREQRLRKSIG